MRSVRTLFAVMALIGFSLTAGSSAERSLAAAGLPIPKNPIPMSDDSIKAGGAVYARLCTGCHGPQGKGDGKAPRPNSPLLAAHKPASLVSGEWKHGGSDAEIFKTIKEGLGPDSAMKPLADKRRRHLEYRQLCP